MSDDTRNDSKHDRDVAVNNTGRVVFDDRGNSVWQWDESQGPAVDDTGELSQLLVPDLEIEGAAEESAEAFNPYNSDPTVRGRRSKALNDLARKTPPPGDAPVIETGDEKEELFKMLKERSQSRRR